MLERAGQLDRLRALRRGDGEAFLIAALVASILSGTWLTAVAASMNLLTFAVLLLVSRRSASSRSVR